MGFIYHSEPFYPTECSILLARAFAPEDVQGDGELIQSIDGFIKKISREYPTSAEQLGKILEPARQISDYVMSKITAPQELLKFYFQLPSECRLLPGHTIALMARHGINPALLQPEQKHKVMSSFLQSAFFPGDDSEALADEAAFADWLEAQKLCAQDKWTALMLYQHPEKYWAECNKILQEAEALYRKKENVWRPVLDACIANFKESMENHGGTNYINEKFHVNFANDSMEIYPSLMGFNSLTLSQFGLEDFACSDNVFLYLGYMIEKLIELDGRNEKTLESLSSQLKAISDSKRLEILTALRAAPLCGQEIAQRVGITPATVSHHMNELLCNGFVSMAKDGAKINYIYSPEGMSSFLQNISHHFENGSNI